MPPVRDPCFSLNADTRGLSHLRSCVRMFQVFNYLTFTLNVTFLPSAVLAVIFTVPAFLAVILPLLLMVATFLFEVVHLIFWFPEVTFLPFASVTVAFTVAFLPFFKV